MLRFRKSLLVAALLASLALLPGASSAQADYAVQPVRFMVKRSPGTASVGTFRVRLTGERHSRFSVVRRDVAQLEDGGLAFAKPANRPFSAASWIAVEPAGFRGAPNRAVAVQWTLRVPRDAEPGTHAAALLVRRQPTGKGQIEALQATAVEIFVAVRGPTRRTLDVVAVDAPRLTGSSSVPFDVTVRNTGTVHADFGGKQPDPGALRVSGGARRTDFRFDGLLLPGATRRFHFLWEDPPLVGRVRARASVGDLGAARSVTVWVLPWRQALALLLVVAGVAVLAVGRRRRLRSSS